jgi:hypothetical protein
LPHFQKIYVLFAFMLCSFSWRDMKVYVFLSIFSSRPTSLQQTNKVDFQSADTILPPSLSST